MTAIRTLLFAAAVLSFASPALAGDQSPWWRWTVTGGTIDTAARNWVCGAFEARSRCNAELHPRTNRCACITR